MGLLTLAHVGFPPTGLSAPLGAQVVPPLIREKGDFGHLSSSPLVLRTAFCRFLAPPPCMSRCLSSCVAVSAKQSTIITHTSVRAEDCSRSSAGARKRQRARLHERSECIAYRSRDNLPHAITVCVSNPIASTVTEYMKRARKRALQKSGVATSYKGGRAREGGEHERGESTRGGNDLS